MTTALGHLELGAVVDGRYRLERVIGEGGTGIVLAATDVEARRPVAIKFLRAALVSDELKARFEREAAAIARIQSEHVVLVLDAGALDDGLPFMVMELLEGRDLARVLADDGPMSVGDAVTCMLQVCDALTVAHRRGIVHRDLKPANLFLARREGGALHVKVLDFGISKILDKKVVEQLRWPHDVTSAHTVLGSPRYMAPEQLRDSTDVDARADLWSVGAVLYQLVTGKRAFEGPTGLAESVSVLARPPRNMREHAPGVPPELEAVVMRCLCKEREGRYATAADLAEALRPLAGRRYVRSA